MSVELRNISKRFKDVVAVDNVSLKIEKGEFFVFLGPSGSGKSTLLRIIAGLEDPDSGEVLIEGKIVNEVDASKRDVAFVFQNYALYPHMRVYDNISFPLRMKKYPKEQIQQRVLEVAEMLGITHLLEKYPYQLSGGEQQRVALARAIVRRPKVFLLDEPLSNLDAKLRTRLRFELRKLLHDDLKTTTVYVTHDQVEAMTMADRIAVINKGRVVQVDEPSLLYEKPKSVFVASFIGAPSMNLLVAEATSEGVRMGKHLFRVRDVSVKPGNVIIGLRPQDLVPGEGELTGTLVGVERLGSGLILHMLIERQEVTVYVERGRIELSPGESLSVNPVGPLYLFDPETEELIGISKSFSVELSS
ncbi:MAG: ABC transporter ATP-binding protein [Thermofilum sp.]